MQFPSPPRNLKFPAPPKITSASRKKGYIADTKQWKMMKANLQKGKVQIDLGWFEGQVHLARDGGLIPSAQLAKWNEEGTWNSPSRPAIRTLFIPTIAEASDFTPATFKTIDAIAMGKMTWKQLHVKMAPKVLHMFKLSMQAYHVKPNAPATVAKKGFNDPWVETGALIDSAGFRISDYKLYPSRNYTVQTLRFT